MVVCLIVDDDPWCRRRRNWRHLEILCGMDRDLEMDLRRQGSSNPRSDILPSDLESYFNLGRTSCNGKSTLRIQNFILRNVLHRGTGRAILTEPVSKTLAISSPVTRVSKSVKCYIHNVRSHLRISCCITFLQRFTGLFFIIKC